MEGKEKACARMFEKKFNTRTLRTIRSRINSVHFCQLSVLVFKYIVSRGTKWLFHRNLPFLFTMITISPS